MHSSLPKRRFDMTHVCGCLRDTRQNCAIGLGLDRGRCAKWRWAKTETADRGLNLVTRQKCLRLHDRDSMPRCRRQAMRVLKLGPDAVPVMIYDVVLIVLMID